VRPAAVFAEARRGVARARGRSQSALLGVALGVAAVVTLLSAGTSMRRQALAEFERLGSDLVSLRWAAGAAGRSVGSTETAALVRTVPELAAATPVVALEAELRGARAARKRVPVLRAAPDFAALHRLRLAHGRFLSDLDGNGAVAVVGSALAARLAASGPLVGSRLDLGGRAFLVLGALAPSAATAVLPYTVDESIVVPLASRVHGERATPSITARLRAGGEPARLREELEGLFAERGAADLEVIAAAELLERRAHQLRLYTLLLGFLGCVALVVGGAGISNVMALAVGARRREIGVRRSLGARQADVERQFLLEAVLLALGGGVLGLLLGVLATWALAGLAGWSREVSGLGILLGLAVSVALGVASGWLPARQAARLSPAAALRG
jgi:putative ABC transport system permease protein